MTGDPERQAVGSETGVGRSSGFTAEHGLYLEDPFLYM